MNLTISGHHPTIALVNVCKLPPLHITTITNSFTTAVFMRKPPKYLRLPTFPTNSSPNVVAIYPQVIVQQSAFKHQAYHAQWSSIAL